MNKKKFTKQCQYRGCTSGAPVVVRKRIIFRTPYGVEAETLNFCSEECASFEQMAREG